jgi:predicted RNA-binding Zn-ribbon protein involved in translation (DUF1610 family)
MINFTMQIKEQTTVAMRLSSPEGSASKFSAPNCGSDYILLLSTTRTLDIPETLAVSAPRLHLKDFATGREAIASFVCAFSNPEPIISLKSSYTSCS